MVRKEAIITASLIVLVTYTMSISLITQAYPQSQTSKTISSSGNVEIQASPGLGVYSNQQGTQTLNSIAWGSLEPGQSTTKLVYIKNEGNVPLTISLNTGTWSSTEAQNYLTLTWNYDGQPINPGEIKQVALTLNVDANTWGITDFSFNIIIVGS